MGPLKPRITPPSTLPIPRGQFVLLPNYATSVPASSTTNTTITDADRFNYFPTNHPPAALP